MTEVRCDPRVGRGAWLLHRVPLPAQLRLCGEARVGCFYISAMELWLLISLAYIDLSESQAGHSAVHPVCLVVLPLKLLNAPRPVEILGLISRRTTCNNFPICCILVEYTANIVAAELMWRLRKKVSLCGNGLFVYLSSVQTTKNFQLPSLTK
jgi:hypothetical protein